MQRGNGGPTGRHPVEDTPNGQDDQAKEDGLQNEDDGTVGAEGVAAEARTTEDRAAVRAVVAGLMARVVAGDDAALFEMMAEFGHRVRFKVLGILRDIGRSELASDDVEVDGMVTEAFLVIRDRAAGWSPDGGALPWNWAFLAIRARIHQIVGHRVVELEDEWFDGPAPEAPDDPPQRDADAEEFFRALSERLGDRRVGFFLAAVRHHTTSEEQYQKVLEFLMQKYLGDPSPSRTVAILHGAPVRDEVALKKASDNVRQIASRTRRKILAAIDGADEAGWNGPWLDGLEPKVLLAIEWLGGGHCNGGDDVA